jgi:hypothetical protein
MKMKTVYLYRRFSTESYIKVTMQVYNQKINFGQ